MKSLNVYLIKMFLYNINIIFLIIFANSLYAKSFNRFIIKLKIEIIIYNIEDFIIKSCY